MNIYLQWTPTPSGICKLEVIGWLHDCSQNPHRDECCICAAADEKEKRGGK